MSYRVEFTKQALKQLRKMDHFDSQIILEWIERRLECSDDPRVWGKGLSGKGLSANRSGQWSYRVGDYRILCVIHDDVVTIEVFSVEHRNTVYR